MCLYPHGEHENSKSSAASIELQKYRVIYRFSLFRQRKTPGTLPIKKWDNKDNIAQKLNLTRQDEQRNKTIYFRQGNPTSEQMYVSVQNRNCEIL